jgi:hypothetical protein
MNGHDEARDLHLREALRHAPDAQLQAPPELSEFILKEARAKARDPKLAGTAAPGWPRRTWDWLAHPAVATGFAGVMAATLVGLMWWDQPMDEALPRRPAPATAPMVEKASPAAAPAASALVPTRPQPDAIAPAPQPEPARKKAADASRSTQSGSTQPGSTAPARPSAAERDTGSATGGLAEATQPAPPMAAPARAAPSLSVSADAAPEAALAKARAAEEAQKRERSGMAPVELQSRRAAAKAQLNESRLRLEGEAYTRVASVRAAIAGEPARWSWQRANAASQPMNDAVSAWLAQLDGSTGTGWQPHGARETTAPRGRALALLRDGEVQHSFQLTERGVLWQRGQTEWQMELPAEALATLQAALDTAMP